MVSKAESMKSAGIAESALLPYSTLLLDNSLQMLMLHFMVKLLLIHVRLLSLQENVPWGSFLTVRKPVLLHGVILRGYDRIMWGSPNNSEIDPVTRDHHTNKVITMSKMILQAWDTSPAFGS